MQQNKHYTNCCTVVQCFIKFLHFPFLYNLEKCPTNVVAISTSMILHKPKSFANITYTVFVCFAGLT